MVAGMLALGLLAGGGVLLFSRSAGSGAMLDQHIGRMKTRLNLSPGQAAKVRSILEEELGEVAELRQKYRNAAPSAATEELARIRKAASARLKSVFTEQQSREYIRMLDEQRRAVRPRGMAALPPRADSGQPS